MHDDELVQLRAERLRVALDLARGMPTLDVEQAASSPRPTPWGFALASGVTGDDLALASAALTVEHELRAEAWDALSGLLALIAERHGPLDERVLALEGHALVSAARSLSKLGWLDRPR